MNEEVVGYWCGQPGHALHPSVEASAAYHFREATVFMSSMLMNRRGVDFQPAQVWTATHKPSRRSAPRTKRVRAERANSA